MLSHGYGPDAIVVKVPVRCVGTLMGSRGAKMKEIKEKTGARVTLSKVGGWKREGGREGGRVRCVGLLMGSRGAKMKEIKQEKTGSRVVGGREGWWLGACVNG